MAYDKKKLYKQAEEAIEEHGLYYVEEVISFIPCSKETFYRLFPIDSNEYDTLRRNLDDNKTKIKAEIRAKLKQSDKAAELLALYRLLSTPEEHQKLNQAYIDHTSKGKNMSLPLFNIDPLADEVQADNSTEEDSSSKG